MSRSDARSTSLRRRPARVIPATIVAVILLAAGIGLVWITVLRLRDGAWPTALGRIDGWASALTWGSTMALLIAAAGVLVGLVLLIAGIKPGVPNAMTLTADPGVDPDGNAITGSTELVMPRRAVAKLATGSAARVDGVEGVSATVSGRRVVLAVTSPSERRDQVQTAVTTTVTDALRRAGLAPVPTVRANVRTTRP